MESASINLSEINPIKRKRTPSPSSSSPKIDGNIDWNGRNDGTMIFQDRLADAYMGKQLHSDMMFFVESENTYIPAHSLIVAAGSEVLERLVYGTGSIVNTDRVVQVPDCPVDAFKHILQYLYTGDYRVK